jgi:tetratricopeptide (TPR) repeat protein
MIKTLRCIPTSFAPANATAWLTGIAERISKSETFGSRGIGQNTGVIINLFKEGVPMPRKKGRSAMIAVALIGAAVLLAKTPLLIAFAAPQSGARTQLPVLISQTPAQPDFPIYQPPPAQPQILFDKQRAQGVAQMKAGQYDAAIATFQDLLSRATDVRVKANLWEVLGEAYREKGDFANSIWFTQQAFQLLPGNAAIAANLGMLYERQNDKVHARPYYEKAIAIDPNNVLALNNLAYLLAETNGDLDRALRYARAAQQKLPRFPAVNDTVGWVYLKKNILDGAIGSFKIAVQQEPQNPEYHYHLALALYQQGSLREAMDECKTALMDKPAPDIDKFIHELMDKIAPQSDTPATRLAPAK